MLRADVMLPAQAMQRASNALIVSGRPVPASRLRPASCRMHALMWPLERRAVCGGPPGLGAECRAAPIASWMPAADGSEDSAHGKPLTVSPTAPPGVGSKCRATVGQGSARARRAAAVGKAAGHADVPRSSAVEVHVIGERMALGAGFAVGASHGVGAGRAVGAGGGRQVIQSAPATGVSAFPYSGKRHCSRRP